MQILKLSLMKKVMFLGPRSDVAGFMKSSDLLVHPAREEAAGNIIIEAVVSGLPTLVSSEVGFSSEVLNLKSGVVVGVGVVSVSTRFIYLWSLSGQLHAL